MLKLFPFYKILHRQEKYKTDNFILEHARKFEALFFNRIEASLSIIEPKNISLFENKENFFVNISRLVLSGSLQVGNAVK